MANEYCKNPKIIASLRHKAKFKQADVAAFLNVPLKRYKEYEGDVNIIPRDILESLTDLYRILDGSKDINIRNQ